MAKKQTKRARRVARTAGEINALVDRMKGVRNYISGRHIKQFTPIYLSLFPEDASRIQVVRNVYAGTGLDEDIINRFEDVVEYLKAE